MGNVFADWLRNHVDNNDGIASDFSNDFYEHFINAYEYSEYNHQHDTAIHDGNCEDCQVSISALLIVSCLNRLLQQFQLISKAEQ